MARARYNGQRVFSHGFENSRYHGCCCNCQGCDFVERTAVVDLSSVFSSSDPDNCDECADLNAVYLLPKVFTGTGSSSDCRWAESFFGVHEFTCSGASAHNGVLHYPQITLRLFGSGTMSLLITLQSGTLQQVDFRRSFTAPACTGTYTGFSLFASYLSPQCSFNAAAISVTI